ncbi:MAG: gliding motility lipoprotein GldH [Flavobacteriales bacterium]|nr:gliding motility lipoprotein GldH [Flavobacteriales bacterium]MBP9078769.1 gliding motility lipoprotein GldH [Flavobacteriales bacterium]
MSLAACTGHVAFQQSTQVPDGIWDRTWKPQFTFDVADTLATKDIYLDIRHTGDYPFSNLYLFTTLQGPDGRTFSDTVECTLADPVGRWYGKGTGFIFSDRFQAHVLYRMNNRFPRPGRYVFTMEQAMRTEQLAGVIDVGISVEQPADRP